MTLRVLDLFSGIGGIQAELPGQRNPIPGLL